MSDKTTHSATDDESVAQKGQAETNTDHTEDNNHIVESLDDAENNEVGDDKNDTNDDQSDDQNNNSDADSTNESNDKNTEDDEADDSQESDHSQSDQNANSSQDAGADDLSDIREAEIVEDAKDESATTSKQSSSDNCKCRCAEQRDFSDTAMNAEFQKSIREQIENCQKELQESLQKSIREDFRLIAEKQIAKANRRRRWSNFFHDLVIIILVAVAVYFGYCLYDVQYFPFMKTQCTDGATDCQADLITTPNIDQTAGPVKDSTWYLANYSYLFENLRLNLSGDNISAYYLYNDDRRAAEIAPKYLLAMAYSRTNLALNSGLPTITVAGDAMRTAFTDTFGSLDYYEPVDFDYSCWHFQYTKNDDAFVAANTPCNESSQREIIEQVDKIYEEGEAIYVITHAAVYDRVQRELYNLNNLFQPIAVDVEKQELEQYQAKLNRYQYQFKKSGEDDKYYFTSITKLK